MPRAKRNVMLGLRVYGSRIEIWGLGIREFVWGLGIWKAGDYGGRIGCIGQVKVPDVFFEPSRLATVGKQHCLDGDPFLHSLPCTNQYISRFGAEDIYFNILLILKILHDLSIL